MPLKQVSEIRYRLVISKRGKAYRQCFADYLCSYCESVSEKIAGSHNRQKSCGCQQRRLKSEAGTTHGKCGTRTYRSWQTMIQRCTNPNHTRFKLYGDTGRTVCTRWLSSFAAFLSDMGERPVGCSLDRIDNSRGYEPGNCRWVDQETQNRNKRNNRILTIDGISRCVSEWAEQPGAAKRMAIYNRLRLGWPHREAVFGKEKQK